MLPESYFQKAVAIPPWGVLAVEREHLMSLPPESALDAILDSPHAPALVQSIPEGDLHLLVNEIGAEDALPLLSMASDDQWSYILDMEIWDGDQIASASFTSWLNHLMEADPERLTGSFFESHLEDMALYLFKNVEVKIAGTNIDPEEADDSWDTFDREFFFRPINAPDIAASESYIHDREGILLRFLEHLASQDYSRYLEIMLEAAAVMPSEAEEYVYRLRNERLAERGFLPFEKATGIYQPLASLDVEQLVGRSDVTKPKSASRYSSLLSLLQADRKGDVFNDALALIDNEETVLRIQEELAGLANQIITADRLKIRERDQLDAVVQKATGYTGIGLESIASRDGQTDLRHAASLLGRLPLSVWFRIGYGLALKVKAQASRWYRESWPVTRSLSDDFWSEYWQGVLEGLLVEKPRFYCGYSNGVSHREFSDLNDIQITKAALRDIIAVDKVLSLVPVPALPDALDGTYSYKNLLLTLWARDRAGLPNTSAFVTSDQFGSLFRGLWSRGSPAPKVKASIKVSFLVWISRTTGTAYSKIAHRLGGVTDDLFADIQTELGHMDADRLDPRFIELFLIGA